MAEEGGEELQDQPSDLTPEQALEAATSATRRAEATLPLAVKLMNDLKTQTLDLAETMEEYARQLKIAAGILD